MTDTMMVQIFFLVSSFWLSFGASADVVKPTLTEIEVTADGHISIELRTSLEALLSGIDARYRNTQDAPNAAQYDGFRQQSAAELADSFESFQPYFLESVRLTVDAEPLLLKMDSIEIPEPGYTQVARMSTLRLSAQWTGKPQQLRWYFPARFGDHAVRVVRMDASQALWHWSDYQWIRDGRVSEPFILGAMVSEPEWFAILHTYVGAGFSHVLPLGLDHLLFILGMFLLAVNLRLLCWQVSMFTLAHSVTLSLAVLGVLSPPSHWVEPLIALSIVYIAVENLCRETVKTSRLWVVFAFGLLHGFGFATLLVEFGLPDAGFFLALLGFNLGVEMAQISVLLLAWFGLWCGCRFWPGLRHWVVMPASALIAMTGLWWFWQRLPLA